ncbi:MAG TPA: hypothetical protein VFO19_10440 [Vicinamibacterales bacterium]|nr:hypothetical protein [Vicinamibacterales bacterium]
MIKGFTHVTIALAMSIGAAACARGVDAPPVTFQTGIVGTAPAGTPSPMATMNDAAVRSLILQLTKRPLAAGEAAKILSTAPYDIAAVVGAGLARRDGDTLHLAVSFLSADDQKLIAIRSRGYGRELADLVLARRTEIESAVETLAATEAERRALLFFLVGCLALDWEGLEYTQQAGYRAAATVTGPGFSYTPWMKENAPDLSRRGLYWGSHNRAAGDHTFTTFGDHDALPRRALPDLLFANAASSGSAGVDLADASRVLQAIDAGARSLDRIAEMAALTDARLATTVTFLETIGYVGRGDAGYTHHIVLVRGDARPAVAKVVGLVRDQVSVWHERRASELRRELATLTALGQGVPFEVLYTDIWHYVFGFANLFLAEGGLITDPYADTWRFRGFVPVLWANQIREPS